MAAGFVSATLILALPILAGEQDLLSTIRSIMSPPDGKTPLTGEPVLLCSLDKGYVVTVEEERVAVTIGKAHLSSLFMQFRDVIQELSKTVGGIDESQSGGDTFPRLRSYNRVGYRP